MMGVTRSEDNSFATRRKLLQMEMLYDVGLELGSSLDPTLLVDDILNRTLVMSDARGAALIKREEDGSFRVAAAASVRSIPSELTTLVELSAAWDECSPVSIHRDSLDWCDLSVVPLPSRQGVEALLIVADKEHRDGSTGPFSAEDKALLQAFANQAGVALQNAELHRNLSDAHIKLEHSDFENRRQLLQMESLYDIGLELSSSLDPILIAEEILNRGLVMVDARGAALVTRREDTGSLQVSAQASAAPFPAEILSIPEVEKAWQSREGVLVERDAGVWRYIYLLPLSCQDYVGGLLIVADKEQRGGSISPFGADDQSLLQSFAYQAGSALRNALLHRDLMSSYEDLRKAQDSKEFVQNAFGNYLSPTVVEHLIENPNMVRERGGEERVMTAFFSDVANFSSIAEAMSPSELVGFLNKYLTEMCEIIEKYGGTIDKFEGDAVVGFFGAPLYFEDHARRAILASVEQQRQMQELRRKWAQPGVLAEGLAELHRKWRASGLEFMKIRMGLATGPIVVGNMGSKTRADYTMMGDTVNVAARLESMQKIYGTNIVVNDVLYALVKEQVEARKLDDVRVIGRMGIVGVYEVLEVNGNLDEQCQVALGLYEEGRRAYEDFRFTDAVPMFEEALRLAPQDGPSRLHLKRSRAYAQDPPDDLVYQMAQK